LNESKNEEGYGLKAVPFLLLQAPGNVFYALKTLRRCDKICSVCEYFSLKGR